METNDLSPVVIIKQKELDLAERQTTAKQAAERVILEARQWATEYRDRAEREGQDESAVYYRAELEACEAEADKVLKDGELASRWIAERGTRGLDQAVQLILDIVLPSLSPPESSISPPGSRVSRNLPETHRPVPNERKRV